MKINKEKSKKRKRKIRLLTIPLNNSIINERRQMIYKISYQSSYKKAKEKVEGIKQSEKFSEKAKQAILLFLSEKRSRRSHQSCLWMLKYLNVVQKIFK